MAKRLPHLSGLFLLLLASISLAQGPAGRFDLAGPKIDIRVTRKGESLPIAAVPTLQPGDQIWLHPALPPTQSVHYLLIAVFLRGTTNPPPDNWFTRIETWNRKVREEGVTVTVPAEAQQAVLFLAPETGGDYSTLKSAVTGRPGIFVRATQDLNEAGFEQARIEKYVAEMQKVPPSDATALQEHSNLLARTLNLKPNPDCFKRSLDQQYNCLTQTGTQTLLDDGHGQTVVAALSNGPSSDFINQASYMGAAGAGVYSAYVGAIVDLIRLTSTLHTAQYQYIPAIAFPTQESLNLRLNTAPSFHNPKSVLVIGLPAVSVATPPPLRPSDPNHVSCLLQPRVAIPIEGAPLVFSTALAHDLTLHLNATVPGADGKAGAQDLPLVADAFQGGLTIAPTPPARKELPDTAPAVPRGQTPPAAPPPAPPAPVLKPGEQLTGTIVGMWGFDHFTGPTVPLQGMPGKGWRIAADSHTNLIVGQPNHLQLVSSGTACIEAITLEPVGLKAEWKLASGVDTGGDGRARLDRPVDLTLNLQHAETPGTIQLAIQQFGQPKPDQLGTKTFSEPARIEALTVHEGDRAVTLAGTSLQQVKLVAINNTSYAPDFGGTDKMLNLSLARDSKTLNLKVGEHFTAKVELADGRTLDAPSVVLLARPSVTLISKRIAPQIPAPAVPGSAPAAAVVQPITLAKTDDVPLGAQLLFFLKSDPKFPRNEEIEVATLDESLKTNLSIAAGTLVLQDSHTVLGKLDPLKTFGTSAFGPLRLRALTAEGVPGEWLPLATLVRLPILTSLRCPSDTKAACTLAGSDLFLIDSIDSDPNFATPTIVPEGFVETSIAIERPVAGAFYVKLRDDPGSVHGVSLPIMPEPGAARAGTKATGVAPTATPLSDGSVPGTAQTNAAPGSAKSTTPGVGGNRE